MSDRLEDFIESHTQEVAEKNYELGRAEAFATPIDMVLHCPKCGSQHIDAPEPLCGSVGVYGKCVLAKIHKGMCMTERPKDVTVWENPPHKSHLCHGCGTIWRPADLPTNGVVSITTRGEGDTWPELPTPLTADIHRCQRCGTDHKGLVFTPLLNPADEWSHYALCPSNGQPVQLRIVGKVSAFQ